MKLGPLVAAALIVGSAAGTAYWIKASPAQQATQSQGRPGGGRRMQSAGAAPVAVATVTRQSVPVYRDGIGNVQALNTVTVRAQVDGRLLSVDFNEGQDVKKGQTLARIDPAIYKAQYDQAVAKKAQDEANLANLKVDLERYTKLAKSNAGPQQQADQQVAAVAQMVAQIQSDQAQIDNAKATLDYTTVVSPLDGRVGLRLVDPGNIVHASDTSGIVTITQVKPIAVVFTLPQRDLAITAKALAGGTVPVQIPNEDASRVLAAGTLQSIDNQIDVTTGTVKLKAVFANDDQSLWPGEFVAARVVVATLGDVKVVPATAVRRGVDGDKTYNFVYTVGTDNVARIKRITVPQQDDKIAVVEGDIDVGQSVVTEGFTQLADGKEVVVATSGPSGAAAAPAAADGKRAHGEHKGDWQKRKKDGAAKSADPAGGPATDAAGGGASGSSTSPPASPAANSAPGGQPDAAKRHHRRRDEASADGSPAVGEAKGAQQ